MDKILYLKSFANAIASLEEALEEYTRNTNDFIRDSCIQRFEYTYELSHKMLKRYLEMTSAYPTEIETMSFQNLIRTGCEKSLLRSGWDKWKQYRMLRGTTSHAYDAKKAQEVFAVIPDFLKEAQYLLKQLEYYNEL